MTGLRGLRGRLLATVVLAAAVGLAIAVAAFNVVLSDRLGAQVDDVLRARAGAALDSAQVVDGRLSAPEAADDAALDRPVWLFAGRRAVERPAVGPGLTAAATALAGGPRRIENVPGRPVRLLALPVRAGGRRIGTVVGAVSTASIARTERTVLVASVILACVLLAAAALAGRWLLRVGLRPVTRMTDQAAEWSEHDVERRFDLGPPRDELTRLGATLDGLLDRLATVLRREQLLSAEISHELRTPLARLRAGAQLALGDRATPGEREDALRAVIGETDRIADTLDALLLAARAEGDALGGTADADAAARSAAEHQAPALASRGLALSVEPAGAGSRLAVEPAVAERILGPLLDNAGRHARRRVRLRVEPGADWTRYEVLDDGPGVTDDELERIFEPGARGAAGAGGAAGLGLPLARRLARAAGGDVTATATEGGRFVVRLPTLGAQAASSAASR